MFELAEPRLFKDEIRYCLVFYSRMRATGANGVLQIMLQAAERKGFGAQLQEKR